MTNRDDEDREYEKGERDPLKPSPLESSADAAGEWDVDARMAEAAAGMSSDECSCKVGLGKFEGEPVEVFLLYHGDDDDNASIEDGGGWWGRYNFPIANEWGDDEIKAALDYGYCDRCIRAALVEMESTRGGVILFERSDGIVDSEFYTDTLGTDDGVVERLEKRWLEIQDGVVEANGPQDDDWVTEDFNEFHRHGTKAAPENALVVKEGRCWKCALLDRMDRDNYWPNVWSISDHGNVTLLVVSDVHKHE